MNPHTELESRQILAAGAALAALLALIIPMTRDDRGIPIAIHIPSAQIEPAVSAAAASTLAAITGSGNPFVTITPKPQIVSATR